MSASIILRKSADEVPPGVTAISRSLSDTPGSVIALRKAASSLAAIAGGVFAGVKKPDHSLVLTSAKPASAMLGTFGSCGERSEPVTASARTLPELICGIAGGPSEIDSRQFCCMTQRIISLLDLRGIATPGMPVLSLSSSVEIVNAGDVVP